MPTNNNTAILSLVRIVFAFIHPEFPIYVA